MSKFDDKSNNEILTEIKQMQANHEALKIKMLADYDRLMQIEKEFLEANNEMDKRLKGNNLS